uniref:Uncharacterized protein n=1 Tax=Glossina morsitans morsitans TaxID=37546 RepID=A0A1B0G0A9_GLOMM
MPSFAFNSAAISAQVSLARTQTTDILFYLQLVECLPVSMVEGIQLHLHPLPKHHHPPANLNH